MLTTAGITLITAVFVASVVEAVEAFTIVLAMGVTRSWRAALVGTLAALLALAAITSVVGIALTHYVSRSLLQFVIGALLLVFGLQWLRKAVLRSSGLKAVHDEAAIFRKEQEAAQQAGREQRLGLDWFAFVVSFKGVLLEGLEVVFIVLTFGLRAQAKTPHAMALASAAAGAAAVAVIIAGVAVHKPLSAVPENTMKYAVGLMLTTFGTFWSGEGLGYFGPRGQSLEWPGGDIAIVLLLLAWLIVSYFSVLLLRSVAGSTRGPRADAVRVPTEVGGGN
jgi:Ca2+/H+ antiporter, TMEM165/GDT1 family